MAEKKMTVPPWLEPLLTTSFFSVCGTHPDATRSERNMFCLDCPDAGAFCADCRSSTHEDHQVIQIRRSSYHDVVRVSEIQKEFDVSGVQTYVINSARVLFLNQRPQPKTSKAVTYICEICGRSLLENSFSFCSLGCKLMAIKRKNGEESSERRSRGGAFSSRSGQLSKDENEGSKQDLYPSTPSPQPTSARRRKGVPRRAPLGS